MNGERFTNYFKWISLACKISLEASLARNVMIWRFSAFQAVLRSKGISFLYVLPGR
jgi:hypothetical protein